MRLRTLLCLLCIASIHAQDQRLPAFEDYPVANRYRGRPAAPQFGTKQLPDTDQRARDTIELQAEDGPNFAGHFTIAHWSCDTGCFRIIVIDAINGRVYRDVPFTTLDIGYDHDTEQHRYGGLSFRAASSLLVAEGCFDGESHISKGQPPDCSRRYYRWDGAKFSLLTSVPVE
jgi:hypothetical protein